MTAFPDDGTIRHKIEFAHSAGEAHRLIVCAIRFLPRGWSTAIAGRADAFEQALHIIEAATNGWHHIQPSEVSDLTCDIEARVIRHPSGAAITFQRWREE